MLSGSSFTNMCPVMYTFCFVGDGCLIVLLSNSETEIDVKRVRMITMHQRSEARRRIPRNNKKE